MNTKQIMTTAWTIARHGAVKFGGSVRSYLSNALRQAWAEARRPSQKEIARELDRAAARAEMIGHRPATSKQCWYLAGLMAKDIDGGRCYTRNSNFVLDSKRASHLIGIYVDCAA